MVFGGGDKTKPKPERNHDQELKRRTYVIRIFPQ
jgi:hypothetical protein